MKQPVSIEDIHIGGLPLFGRGFLYFALGMLAGFFLFRAWMHAELERMYHGNKGRNGKFPKEGSGSVTGEHGEHETDS